MSTTILPADLPAHIHVERLAGTDIVTGEHLARIIVWADRVLDRCPQCHEPIDRELITCPVILNPGSGLGGRIEERDQRHGCGEWLSVGWAGARESRIGRVARDLAAERDEEIDDVRTGTLRRLRALLTDTVAAWAAPLEDGETRADREYAVSSGSETEPGTYRRDDGQWRAWAYDPAGIDPEGLWLDESSLGR